MLGVIVEARVINTYDLGVRLQILADGHGVIALPLDSQRQRL